MDALRGLLGEAKFHQYLTDRRTLALLGVASDIFGLVWRRVRLRPGIPDHQPPQRSGPRPQDLVPGGETFLAFVPLWHLSSFTAAPARGWARSSWT